MPGMLMWFQHLYPVVSIELLQSFVRVGRCYYVASAVLQERGRDIEHKRIVINDKHNARQEHLKHVPRKAI